jgi:hypothetical protein
MNTKRAQPPAALGDAPSEVARNEIAISPATSAVTVARVASIARWLDVVGAADQLRLHAIAETLRLSTADVRVANFTAGDWANKTGKS